MKKGIICTLILAIVLSISVCLLPPPVTANAEGASIQYITTPEELKSALVGRQRVIYVGDIAFDTPETIAINYSVTIRGKATGSTIRNLHIELYGSELYANKITVALECIVFDGGFDSTEYDIYQEKPFDQIVGPEHLDGFLYTDPLNVGYYDLIIEDCIVTRYSGYWGAALSLPTNNAGEGEKQVSIKRSSFYGNVGAERIIDITDRNIKLSIENVEMYDNYAVSKIANLTNLQVDIEGLFITNNHFIPLDSADYFEARNDRNMIRGGGLYMGNTRGVVRQLTLRQNETYYGGGLFLALSVIGDGDLVFEDCLFKGNRARADGGAVGLESYVGYPVYFFNCQFIDNHAPQGGSLCAKPFIGDRKDGNTSLIEFAFCDFSDNIAQDDKAFAYYYDGFTRTKRDGRIVLRGCRVQDATFLSGNGSKEDGYNIISRTALAEGAELTVPASDYASWLGGHLASGEARSIGYLSPCDPEPDTISPIQPIFYGICALISIAIAVLYMAKSSEKHLAMVFISIAVCVINIGYLWLSLTAGITGALLANNLAYLGNAFLPLFFVMAVTNVCRFRMPRWGKVGMVAISVVNFLFTLSVWFSDLFYADPKYAIVGGAVDIVKTNGILHTLYVAYVFLYFASILGIVMYSLVTKKLEHKRYALLILGAEFACLLLWTVEMFVGIPYELLSVAYALTSALLATLFFRMEKYGILSSLREVISAEPTLAPADSTAEGMPPVADNTPKYPFDIERVCTTLVERKVLSQRETEILALVLQDASQGTIADTLFISVNTVKFHIKNIYAKLSVASREELRTRITEFAYNEQ